MSLLDKKKLLSTVIILITLSLLSQLVARSYPHFDRREFCLQTGGDGIENPVSRPFCQTISVVLPANLSTAANATAAIAVADALALIIVCSSAAVQGRSPLNNGDINGTTTTATIQLTCSKLCLQPSSWL